MPWEGFSRQPFSPKNILDECQTPAQTLEEPWPVFTGPGISAKLGRKFDASGGSL